MYARIKKIVLSNGKYTNIMDEFEEFNNQKDAGYKTSIVIYGAELDFYVLNTKNTALKEILNHLPIIIFLVMANAVFQLL